MRVANVKQTTAEKVINTAAIGILGGEVAKIVHYQLLPDTVKFAFNNFKKPRETFVREALDGAILTSRRLGKDSNIKIDFGEVFHTANKMYPKIVINGRRATKAIKKTGIVAAAACTLVAALGHFVIEPKIHANKNKEENNFRKIDI